MTPDRTESSAPELERSNVYPSRPDSMNTTVPATDRPAPSRTEPSIEPVEPGTTRWSAGAKASGSGAAGTAARTGGVENIHTVWAAKYVRPNFQHVTSNA